MPTFSIVITTFNRPRRLTACLERVLQQGGGHTYEVIVVDDGSGPQTERALALALSGAEGRIRAVRQKQQGWGAARRLGAQLSGGDILVFLDDDCLAPPGWLDAYANAYAAHPEAVGVAGALHLSQRWNVAGYKQYVGHMAYFNELNAPLGTRTDHEGQCWFSFGGNRSFRREVWLEAAPERGGQWYGDDTLIDRRLRAGNALVWYTPDAWVEHDYRLSVLQRMRAAYRYGRAQRYLQDAPTVRVGSVRSRVNLAGLAWYWCTQILVRAAGWSGRRF
jgi:glycosyltransferase involved in cell wall biosynthesis